MCRNICTLASRFPRSLEQCFVCVRRDAPSVHQGYGSVDEDTATSANDHKRGAHGRLLPWYRDPISGSHADASTERSAALIGCPAEAAESAAARDSSSCHRPSASASQYADPKTKQKLDFLVQASAKPPPPCSPPVQLDDDLVQAARFCASTAVGSPTVVAEPAASQRCRPLLTLRH